MKSLNAMKILSLFLLFATTISITASNVVKHLSNIHGLSNNSVNCILEDSEHTIWMGTWDGLNAYSGREIKTFRYSKSIPATISNNVIRQLIEQGDYLWIATDDGINRLHKKTHQITRYYLRTKGKVPNQEKTFILGKTREEHITCFVKGQGFFLFDAQEEQFKAISANFANEIKDYIIDGKNQILFLFTNGTVGFASIKPSGTTIQKSDLKQIATQRTVDKIIFSNDHFILCSSEEIVLLNKDFIVQKTVVPPLHKSPSHALFLNQCLYVSFIEGGCIKYDLKNNMSITIKEISGQTPIFTLYAGSQNILWCGTDGQGVIQLYHSTSPFKTIHTSHSVRAFCEDAAGNLLIGTKGSGIKQLNIETRKLSDYLDETNGLISNSVYALTKSKNNDLFIGTEGAGINYIDGKSGRLEKLDIPPGYPFFKAVYGLCFTHHDSLLWVGTSGYGLIKIALERQTNRYRVKDVQQYSSANKNHSLNNDIIYALAAEPGDDYLWFGTRGGGVNRIDMNSNRIVGLEDIDNNMMLTNNDVLCLMDSGSELWIGTSYGLNRLNWEGEKHLLTQISENVKLKNNTVHGILQDSQNNIWLSTNQGLACLNQATNQIKNYTIHDGLQNDEFSDGAYYKDSRNLLYFGGVNGLSYFDSQNIRLRDFIAPLALSDFKVYNTSQDMNQRIKNGILKLGYNERFVTFTFIAKDFINNENCEYAYRLVNHSDKWIYLGNNPNLVFTQLPPGNYELEVQSTNGDKVWGNTTYKLTVHVSYPWWLSIYAFIVYGVCCLFLLYLIRSAIKHKIRLNRQRLIDQIEKQQERRMYESKLNFFTNVAHEFFTPLTLIYGPTQYLLAQSGQDEVSRKYLSIIKNNAERMQKLISELMEFRKAKSGYTPMYPESIEVRQLVDSICDNYVDVLKENKIDFRVNIHDVSKLHSDKESLEKILFNLLSNAFKYTARYGFIQVEVWQDSSSQNALRVIVTNSGKGLTEQQLAEIFDKYKIFDVPKVGNSVSTGIGLNLTKNLTELLGGKIEVRSELGKQVEFSVTIPPLQTDTVGLMKGEALSRTDREQQSLRANKDLVVLIVEDEAEIRELLKDILSDYPIKEATDGVEALAEVEKNHPDIIICDILMSNMDGITLIDHLKSNLKTGYIPIVGISAKSSMEDQINAYNHGVNAYITKPFHPRQVISTIENLLSRQMLLKNYFNSSISSIKVKDGLELHPEDEELIRSTIDFIQKNMEDESLNPDSIAEFIGVSKATLYRNFKEITDKTPSEFIRAIKLEHAAKLLRTTKLTVSEIMFKSGFSNKSYFYREFKKQYGDSPTEYRNQ